MIYPTKTDEAAEPEARTLTSNPSVPTQTLSEAKHNLLCQHMHTYSDNEGAETPHSSIKVAETQLFGLLLCLLLSDSVCVLFMR